MQEKSRRGKENAAKMQQPHYMGSGGYAFGRRTWDEKEAVTPSASSSSSASSSAVAPITHDKNPRLWKYLMARTKKDKATNERRIVNPLTNETALRAVSTLKSKNFIFKLKK